MSSGSAADGRRARAPGEGPGLERTIAALRAENLALRIHVQELEHLLLEPGEDRLAPRPQLGNPLME